MVGVRKDSLECDRRFEDNLPMEVLLPWAVTI